MDGSTEDKWLLSLKPSITSHPLKPLVVKAHHLTYTLFQVSIYAERSGLLWKPPDALELLRLAAALAGTSPLSAPHTLSSTHPTLCIPRLSPCWQRTSRTASRLYRRRRQRRQRGRLDLDLDLDLEVSDTRSRGSYPHLPTISRPCVNHLDVPSLLQPPPPPFSVAQRPPRPILGRPLLCRRGRVRGARRLGLGLREAGGLPTRGGQRVPAPPPARLQRQRLQPAQVCTS